jgi:hypothetical protein
MAPLQLYCAACKPVQNCALPPWAAGNFSGTLVLRVSRTLPVAAAAALHVYTVWLHHICAITAKFKLWKTTLRCHVFKLKDPGNTCNIIMVRSTIVAANVHSVKKNDSLSHSLTQ